VGFFFLLRSETLCGAALTAVQKVIERHANFVTGKRLVRLIVAVSRIPALPAYADHRGAGDNVVEAKIAAIK
jgi:hypothetical protein